MEGNEGHVYSLWYAPYPTFHVGKIQTNWSLKTVLINCKNFYCYSVPNNNNIKEEGKDQWML